MDKLKYGNPPDEQDCTDIGTVPGEVAPKRIENSGAFAGKIELMNMYQSSIPDVRRAWMTVAYYREKVRSGAIPNPYSVQIPGVGRLCYHYRDGDNWKIV